MNPITKTTCPYCGVGCGVLVERDADGNVSVRGDKEHPANYGRLCSKGSALAETLDFNDRVLAPTIHGEAVEWDVALDTVAARLRSIIDTHGPDAVGFYVSGQLLTEDYYVANKLMKGFIGSGNIDTNSRLCMSSSVAGHKRAFGSDSVPGCYEDLEEADLIVLTGSNTAWCHPVLYQRIVKAKKARPEMKVVVIDPRETATCDAADLHLPLKPGTDSVLFVGLLAELERLGAIDRDYVAAHTDGLDAALHHARFAAPSRAAVADRCGLSADAVDRFYALWAGTERTVTVYSQGINQTSSGVDKVNAIINCHLATGRIGRVGMGPFSFTGQPNAMGGREVGALANQLAAHMDFDDPAQIDRVGRFWNSARVATGPGKKAVDLFRAAGNGEIKALWIMATNPAVSMPDALNVRAALSACEFVVVSEAIADTDTAKFADVLLPALTWGEKDGTVTNSERRISRQRRFLAGPGEAREDWWILSQVARRMGYAGFDYNGPAAIFREHAALSGFENVGTRGFDISGMATIDDVAYDTLAPFQWPRPAGTLGTLRRFSDGRFDTLDGRARIVPVDPRPPANGTDSDYPLVLNTGRVRDHWHTMTRTGKSPRLAGHIAEPFCSIHPDDAARAGIEDGELVRLHSRWGRSVLRVEVTPTQRQGEVFAPMHWNDRFGQCGRINPVVNPATDPISGQPEFKHTPVRVEAYHPAWHGFILSRRRIEAGDTGYWSRAIGRGFWQMQIAGDQAPADWATHARELLCGVDANAEWLEFHDKAGGSYRAARFVGGRLESTIFIGRDHRLPAHDWVASLFGVDRLESRDRNWLLAGEPGPGRKDAGRIVCACFSVGINTLVDAIRDDGLCSPEEIGEALKAGTNCGSCVPELRRLIAETTA
ncbi:MAG: molybdopterin-dependent oxidoreductase [Gammaproteobacteria bacterium]|nr:molybdopterin-dependent oxidoreductase [Gammaproteobacteria bacterium]